MGGGSPDRSVRDLARLVSGTGRDSMGWRADRARWPWTLGRGKIQVEPAPHAGSGFSVGFPHEVSRSMPEATPPVNFLVAFLLLALLASVVGSWIWAILRVAFRAPVLPRFEPRIVPWGGKSVVLALLMWLAVQVVGQVAFVRATHGPVRRPEGAPPVLSPSEMMVASAILNTAVLAVIPLLLVALCRARPSDLGLAGPARRVGRQVLQGVAAWPLAAPVIYAVMLAAVAIWGKQSHPLESAIQNEGVGRMAFLFFLAGAILAPAAEELIFRGVLLGWLTRLVLEPRAGDSAVALAASAEAEISNLASIPPDDFERAAPPASDLGDDEGNPYVPPRAAIDRTAMDPTFDPGVVRPVATSNQWFWLGVANVAVSTLFAALHYSVWPTPVPIFFLSLVLGVLYQRTGSLIAPVALHMTFNGVSTVLMLLTVGMGFRAEPGSAPRAPTPIPAPVPKPLTPPGSPIAFLPIAFQQMSAKQ